MCLEHLLFPLSLHLVNIGVRAGGPCHGACIIDQRSTRAEVRLQNRNRGATRFRDISTLLLQFFARPPPRFVVLRVEGWRGEVNSSRSDAIARWQMAWKCRAGEAAAARRPTRWCPQVAPGKPPDSTLDSQPHRKREKIAARFFAFFFCPISESAALLRAVLTGALIARKHVIYGP
jgi:hypothetical protein